MKAYEGTRRTREVEAGGTPKKDKNDSMTFELFLNFLVTSVQLTEGCYRM